MKHKSERCSTGHGTGRRMPLSLRVVLDRKRLPRMCTGGVLSERDEALRELHLKAQGRERLRRLLENHASRWPRVAPALPSGRAHVEKPRVGASAEGRNA